MVGPAARDERAGLAVEERVPAEAGAVPVRRHPGDLPVDGLRLGDAAERRADALVAEQGDQPVAVLRPDRLGAHPRGLEALDGDHGASVTRARRTGATGRHV